MASLLERAKQVKERLKEKEIIDSIPAAERDKIYSEIDKAVAANKLRIKDNTFSFKPVKSDVGLPVLINLFAFLLVGGLGVFFYFYFNSAETHIVTAKENVVTAESRLIEALKEESEKKLGEKDQEIESIQSKLQSVRAEQESLIAETEARAQQLESDLRLTFETELEEERRRLQAEGLSAESIDEQLKAFEETKQAEFDQRLADLNSRIEAERKEREDVLNSMVSSYEDSLQQARVDREALEEELQQEFAERENRLAEERDSAVAQLSRFDEMQKQEKLVVDQILSMYSKTNSAIKSGEYDRALENLDSLESFLNQGGVAELPEIQYRRETDMFIIQSLRKLVEDEKAGSELDTDSIIESADILSTVAGIVEEGNRQYESGNYEEAREAYLNAMSKVPVLETGFSKLKDIEQQSLQQEREKFIESLAEGDRYFNSREFDSAVEKYRQALEYLENDSDVVDKLVSQLVDAGLGLETSGGKTLIASRELALLNQAKKEQEERESLISELSSIENRYSETNNDVVSSDNPESDLASLLNTKLLIKEILASDSIREQYPDLHEKMGQYLDAYGKEKEKEGRDAALEEIVALTAYLSAPGSSGPSLSVAEAQQKELFLKFLDNLKNILEIGG